VVAIHPPIKNQWSSCDKPIKQYEIFRCILLILGIILYYLHKMYIVINIPFINFLFGNISFYMISPVVPILLASAYAVAYFIENDKPLLLLLTIFDAFSFPYGTIFAVIFAFAIIYYTSPKLNRMQMMAMIIPLLIALPLAYYVSSPTPPSYTHPSVMVLCEQGGRGEYIIQLQDFPSPQSVEVQSVVIQEIQTLGGNIIDTTINPVNVILADIDSSKLPQLMSHEYVKAIYPNERIVRIFDTTQTLNDVKNLLNIQSVHSNGTGIVVAIVDTGINENIPQLKRGGKSVVIDKYEMYGDYVLPHGTEVACCIASQDPDYPGIAKGVDLLDVEVFHEDGIADVWSIIRGWSWVANWKLSHNRYVICSNSFGCPPTATSSEILRNALDNMVLKYGIPMVVASGNTGSQVMCPGDAKYAFTVGAVDKTNYIASFSSYGDEVDVVSYGVNINTFDDSGNLVTVSGTSFSTPIVAGCFALVAEKEKLPPLAMYDLFRTTAKDLGTPGFDKQYGYGLVDVVSAYSSATNQHIQTTSIEKTLTIALLPSTIGLAVVSTGWRWRYG